MSTHLLRVVARLTRIEHGLILGFVPVGTYILIGGRDVLAALLLYISALFAEMYLFTLNDICNITEDRVNRPDAPLVRGEISLRAAKLLAATSLVLGLLAAITLVLLDANLILSLAVYILALICGTAYNLGLKRVFVLGNFLTSLTTASSFLYGLMLRPPSSSLLPVLLFLTALMACLGREFVKTVIDVEGDRLAGYRTIAIVLGPERALSIAKKVEYGALGLLLGSTVYAMVTCRYASTPLVVASTIVLIVLLRELKRGDAVKLRKTLLKLMALVIIGYFLTAILSVLGL